MMKISDMRPSWALPPEHDYPEDFEHENGTYFCKCMDCDGTFIGHKRRPLCKVCLGKRASTTTEEKEHVRIPVTVETSKGVVHGHITGDPNMPETTRAALSQMMQILAEQAVNGTLVIKED